MFLAFTIEPCDYHAARKQLDFLGIGIHTATGKVGRLDGALRALMGEMYLVNLALHVRRGLEGVKCATAVTPAAAIVAPHLR